MAGAVSIEQERMEYPPTDVGPEWIGAPELWDDSPSSSQGKAWLLVH